MNCPHSSWKTTLGLLLMVAACASARADSLELVNGDHYRGTVVSMTQSNIEFQSEILGRITLARNKVMHINLGEAPIPKPTTNAVARPVGPSLILDGSRNAKSGTRPSSSVGSSLVLDGSRNLSPGAAPQSDAVLQQMRREGIDPALVSQVQQQVFGQGSPVASQKFNDLMGGLMSGSVSVMDIRAQAQDSINQIKEAKQQLGPDADGMFDGYLAILENFVAETATNTTITASPPPASAPATTPPAGTQ